MSFEDQYIFNDEDHYRNASSSFSNFTRDNSTEIGHEATLEEEDQALTCGQVFVYFNNVTDLSRKCEKQGWI